LFQDKARIIANDRICGNYYKLVITSRNIAKKALPGQFVNIRVATGPDLMLRRPLSIQNAVKNRVSVIYKVVGRGTEKLAAKKAGEQLDLIGPLGSGYTLTDGAVLLVGGGTGVASLLFLAAKLRESYNASVTVLIGAKTQEELLCADEFEKLGCAVKICTDDGSLGFKGTVTASLKQYLSILNVHPKALYSCGPLAMLREIGRLAVHFRIPCEVSLEEHMGCGVGACLGCVVNAKNGGYLRVCKDGPVFDIREVALHD
jgi:dihydroorotate dehydrogenase electron transfer subunit